MSMEVNVDVFINKRRFPPPATTEALQAYLCVFCQRILDLDRPHQSSCGDRACYTCLEVLTSEFKQRGIGTVICPGCQQPIPPSEFFLDRAVARELKCILVTCPNNACQWRNSYDKYQYHLQRCPPKRLESVRYTKEPTPESEPATPDPRFSGSEVVAGSNLPLLDMHDYASTRSKVVPGLKRLVPAVMNNDTDECILPPIPRLAQTKVFDDVQRQLCEIEFDNSFLLGIGVEVVDHKISNATEDLQDCYDKEKVIRNEGISPSSMPPRPDLLPDFDPLLPWPFRQTITLVLLSQDPHIENIKQSFKPDGESSSFRRPVSEMYVASGCPQFCPLDLMNDHTCVQDNTLYRKASMSISGIEYFT